MAEGVEESFHHLTGGKTKPWMWGAALGLSVLIYLYYKHSSAGTLASSTTATATDPTAATDTSGGADSALGTPSAGTSTTYNNYYVTETTPKGSSTLDAHQKHLQTLHNEHVRHEQTLANKAKKPSSAAKASKARTELMQSHPSTHPAPVK